MALLNNLYVFVEDESVTHDVESSLHPVENGANITDHVQKKQVELNITGKIIDSGDIKAYEILSQLKQLQISGSLIHYQGRNIIPNLQIQSFSTSHPYTNWGGCDFEMTLKEIKIAKPAYTELTEIADGGTQQVEIGDNEKIYHTVKKGDTLWALVTAQYKSLEPKFSTVMEKCQWIFENSPDAFSDKNDMRTMQVGGKLLVGYRKC